MMWAAGACVLALVAFAAMQHWGDYTQHAGKAFAAMVVGMLALLVLAIALVVTVLRHLA